MSAIINRLYSRRILFGVGTALVAFVVAAGAGWYGWLRPAAPSPPDIPAGLDPAVLDAIGTARRRVLNEGQSGTAWGEYGMVLGANGFDRESLLCFAQAERLDPKAPRWPYHQGLSLTSQSPEAALPFLQRAATLADKFDRGNNAPRLTLAETLLQTGASEEAEVQLKQVLSWEPDNPRAHYDLGVLAAARQDDETAAQHFTIAAASPYASRKACVALAAVRLRQGDEAGAADYGRRAAAASQDPPWDDRYVMEYAMRAVGRRGRSTQAENLMALGRMMEALPILLDLAEDGSDANAQIAAGTAFYRVGQLEKAEHYYRAAVGLQTEQAQANYSLAVILCEEAIQMTKGLDGESEPARAKYREAVACADRALELKSDHALAHLYRGFALQRLGKRNEAIDAFRHAVHLAPEIADIHVALGEALAEDGRKDEAITELRRAVKVAGPNDLKPGKALERVVDAK